MQDKPPNKMVTPGQQYRQKWPRAEPAMRRYEQAALALAAARVLRDPAKIEAAEARLAAARQAYRQAETEDERGQAGR